MTALPDSATYVVIGAGVHGLSTAWHLAMALEAAGKGSGADIVLVDKTGPGAGATGVACGGVRNFYMTSAMHAILRHSVDVWMYDPVNFGFQQVGYVTCGAANQAADYERIHASQNAVDYHSDLYQGNEARAFVKRYWPDFKTDGIDVVLHEKVSGYAGTAQAIAGLAQKCVDHGVRCVWGTAVTGYDVTNGRVAKVVTDQGAIACDVAVLAAGPWTPLHWAWLDQPAELALSYPDGTTEADRDMWTYWRLREGEVYFDDYRDARGLNPPLLRVEQIGTAVNDPATGKKLGDNVYIYWRSGSERMDRPGVQGGTAPVRLGPEAAVDPYGHANDAYQAEPWFADYFCAALGQLMGRFEGCRADFRTRRNGGIGAHTPDNMPVVDWILPNLYMIHDSNHGYKMTGLGKLVAPVLTGGATPEELKPFAFSRYAEGRTFGARNSTSPWV